MWGTLVGETAPFYLPCVYSPCYVKEDIYYTKMLFRQSRIMLASNLVIRVCSRDLHKRSINGQVCTLTTYR